MLVSSGCGRSFSFLQAIGLVSVGNFTVATILLSGLFIYDIFWVFGTDVMVTVAKVSTDEQSLRSVPPVCLGLVCKKEEDSSRKGTKTS